MQPKLYTIAPDRPFLATLAQRLLASTGDDPLALSRVTILLPTRRAARALREAFLRAAPVGKRARNAAAAAANAAGRRSRRRRAVVGRGDRG